MLPGFEKIVEERIRQARKNGAFDNLPGAGKPLNLNQDQGVPEDLRMAYKMLKNAQCLPPEIEAKKEIRKTEELLCGMEDTAEKYRLMKKLNLMILKFNTARNGNIEFDIPQHYLPELVDRFEKKKSR